MRNMAQSTVLLGTDLQEDWYQSIPLLPLAQCSPSGHPLFQECRGEPTAERGGGEPPRAPRLFAPPVARRTALSGGTHFAGTARRRWWGLVRLSLPGRSARIGLAWTGLPRSAARFPLLASSRVSVGKGGRSSVSVCADVGIWCID